MCTVKKKIILTFAKMIQKAILRSLSGATDQEKRKSSTRDAAKEVGICSQGAEQGALNGK